MKAFKLYMALSTLAVIVSVFAFWKFIIVNITSICPLFLIFLSLLQAMTFISSANSAKNDENETSYSNNNTLTNKEYYTLFRIHGLTKIAIIPILVVFTIFFSSVLKIIVPIVVYIASFLLARIIFAKKQSWTVKICLWMQLAAILLFYNEPGKQEKIMLIHKVRLSWILVHQEKPKLDPCGLILAFYLWLT